MLLAHVEEDPDTSPAYLDGLEEGVEKDPDADGPPEQLDQPGGPKEPQEAYVHDPGGVDDAPHHSDKVEGVPRVLEVRLKYEDSEKTKLTKRTIDRHYTEKLEGR